MSTLPGRIHRLLMSRAPVAPPPGMVPAGAEPALPLGAHRHFPPSWGRMDDRVLVTTTDDENLVRQIMTTRRYVDWTGRIFTHCVVFRIGYRSWSVRGRLE